MLLTIDAWEQVWNEVLPILDEYADAHGDFEVGGYLYSELKKALPDSLRRAQNSMARVLYSMKQFADEHASDQ